MNHCILEVILTTIVVAIIGILIREHSYILADGASSLVLQADCTTSLACVEWVGILQGEILHVEVVACVEEGGCYADTLYLWFVDDDGLVHALTDDGDVVTTDGGEASVAEVVSAVRQEDVGTRSIGCCVGSVHGLKRGDETLCVASLHGVPVTILCIWRLLHVDDAEAVEICSARETQSVFSALCGWILENAECAILGSLCINGS